MMGAIIFYLVLIKILFSLLLVIFVVLLRALQYGVHFPIIINLVAIRNRVRVVRGFAIMFLIALFCRVRRYPLDVRNHHWIALVRFLYWLIAVVVAHCIGLFLVVPLAEHVLVIFIILIKIFQFFTGSLTNRTLVRLGRLSIQ